MKTINEVKILGRLGRDAEVKTFDNGGTITKLTVATENNYKNKTSGEWVKETDWHNVVVKGTKSAEAARFRKGQLVELTGRVKTRSYDLNGEKRYLTEILTFDPALVTEESVQEINGNTTDSLLF